MNRFDNLLKCCFIVLICLWGTYLLPCRKLESILSFTIHTSGIMRLDGQHLLPLSQLAHSSDLTTLKTILSLFSLLSISSAMNFVCVSYFLGKCHFIYSYTGGIFKGFWDCTKSLGSGGWKGTYSFSTHLKLSYPRSRNRLFLTLVKI